MNAIKKNYLVDKYKNKLNKKDLERFEDGLDKASEHALSDLLDLDMQLKSKTVTLLLSIFLGFLGADRYYIGDKKLATIKFALCISNLLMGLLIIATFNASIPALIVFILLALSLLIWRIADIFLCYLRTVHLNREALLSAAYAQYADTEKTRSYHMDTYKTMCAYDNYKKKLYQRDIERFKTALYYCTDDAFEALDNLQLKSSAVTVILSILLGHWGAGSFYLGAKKHATSHLYRTLFLSITGGCLCGVACLAFFMINISGGSLYVLIPLLIIAIIFSLAALIIYLILLKSYWKEIVYCAEQVKNVNGQKIIDTLNKYSIFS